MNILLVNLARMGDLVQTTPAAIGLHKKPGVRVSLLVTSNLREFASQLAGVDEVLAFDDTRLLPPLLDERGSLLEAGKVWRGWIEELRQKHFDLIVNLTHDDFSSHLVSLLGGEKILGRQATPGGMIIRGRWMRYFFQMFHFRSTNSYNLADVYRLSASVDGPVIHVQLNPHPLGKELESKLNRLPEMIVALHPGANHPNRRWPAPFYAQLAETLYGQGIGVVLLGGTGESGLCAEIENLAKIPLLHLAGKTSLVELPALLQRVDLLVTNDTGPLHIAAAVGTKTVSIFLAMARPQDTAPCASGHLILETLEETHPCPELHPCPNPVCGTSVPVDAVFGAVQVQLGLRSWTQVQAGRYRLLETVVGDDGMLDLKEIDRYGSERNLDLQAAQMRPLWLSLLEEDAEEPSWDSFRELFTSKDKEAVAHAAVLSQMLFDRIMGLPVLSSTGHLYSLGELEQQWLAHEKTAGLAASLMLLFRLERESLYTQGLEELRNKAPERFERWNDVLNRLSVGASVAEVLP